MCGCGCVSVWAVFTSHSLKWSGWCLNHWLIAFCFVLLVFIPFWVVCARSLSDIIFYWSAWNCQEPVSAQETHLSPKWFILNNNIDFFKENHHRETVVGKFKFFMSVYSFHKKLIEDKVDQINYSCMWFLIKKTTIDVQCIKYKLGGICSHLNGDAFVGNNP